jgi:hypothetical protein
LEITQPHKAHKKHSQARGREKRARGNSKHTHWCEGEDLKEPMEEEHVPVEQELEQGGEELPQIFIKHT